MRVSVIDIGSNSIKLLVADGTQANQVFETIRETRLSPSANAERERISDEAFAAGVAAVCELSELARSFAPVREIIVGTSLLRTAENAADFAAAVKKATGTPLRVLSGTEEAELIAAGVATDASVKTPCAIFDLGGGSLEFIACGNASGGEIFAESFPLGAVRMTRSFFPNPQVAIPDSEIAELRNFLRENLENVLTKKIPEGARAVFCGGAAGICTRLLSEKTARELGKFCSQICKKTFSERIAGGVPEKRADIFPAALVVLSEICCLGKIQCFAHTTRNLRYGVCARLNGSGKTLF